MPRRYPRHFPLALLAASLILGTQPTASGFRGQAFGQDADAPAVSSTGESAAEGAGGEDGERAALAVEAGESTAEQAAAEAASPNAEELDLGYQDGSIELPGGIATLTLPPGLRYLNPERTEFVLEQVWGNPEGSGTLGMIVPADAGPFGENGWGVILQFEETGHVSDADAAGINYDELLETMRAGESERNEERAANQFPTVHLVGWAKPPHYDDATNKLHWARELEFHQDGETSRILNYAIRILGRRGVLELNLVADMAQLPQIDAALPDVLQAVEFNAGHRYADFNPTTDKVAEYGLAALVLGGVAAKSGLLKGILVGLLAAKKFVILGLFAAAAFVTKLFKRKAA